MPACHPGQVIGEGAEAVVYKGVFCGQPVAVKKLKRTFMEASDKKARYSGYFAP